MNFVKFHCSHHFWYNLGQDPQQAFQRITSHLRERYPGHIPQKHVREWVMYKYSGQTLSTAILHASLTEYIVLTGSAINTDGYLGTTGIPEGSQS